MYKANTGKRFTLLVVVVLAVAIFSSLALPVEAAGTPSNIIAFTDKKVYTQWWINAKTSTPAYTQADNEGNQPIFLYATVLDDDGNIMKGRTVQVTLNDTNFDHFEKGVWTRHSDMAGNNTYFTLTKNLNDTGTFGDAVSNDGLYTTIIGMPASLITDVQTAPRVDDHIRVKIDVKDTASNLNITTYILVSWGRCHNTGSQTTSHPAHVSGATGDLCSACHGGYEHFFENVSKTIPDDYLDVHFKVLGDSLPDSTTQVKNGFIADWRWNSTQHGDTVTDFSWKNKSGGGGVYCLFCHLDPAGSNVFDYGGGERATPSDRPSCSQSTSGYNGLSCHSTTEIEGTTVIPWSQGGVLSSSNDTLESINNQKSHNHTGNNANVSCTLCHTVPHGLTMPNMSADISSNGVVSYQCESCHNRSDGWINGTSNLSHPLTSPCKNCHVNNDKLDSHIVPTGVFGGKWCMNCHNMTGKSPIHLDEIVTNSSNLDYIHYELNKGSDATNTSRICWGCHTNNSVIINGAVNQSSLPISTHPEGYNTPKECLDCHYNTSSTNFSAPQNYRHTWYATNMVTSAVTYCTDCHYQDEMLLIYNQSATAPTSDNETVSHYGRNRTAFFESLGEEYCQYCHQNETTVFGPFANDNNKIRSDHASQVTTPSCNNATCHKDGMMHEDTLVLPVFNESNIASTCQNPSCHLTTEYNPHNGSLTCWDCHMGNVSNTNSTWIHPIQFIQYNGNFTGAKLTGATCYDCHKSTNVDATIQNLSAKTAPKVNNQAHSNAPNNGTIWGQYWDYTPTTFQFADYNIIGGNGTFNPSYPFDNIKVPSNDYFEFIETQTGRIYDETFPTLSYERDFSSTPSGNWTSSTATGGTVGTVSALYDSISGNPAGSLKGQLTTSGSNGQHFGYIWWNYSFNYNPGSGGIKSTNASVNYSVTVQSATYAQNVYLNLVKPSGAVVTLASSGAITTNTGWLILSNNSFASALNENGSVTPYKLQLYAVLSGPKTSQVFTVNYDNVNLRIKEKVYNRYELSINTTNVPVNGSSKLGMSYQIHQENTSLYIFNKTSQDYDFLDTIDDGVFFDYIIDINSTYHIDNTTGDGTTGNVSVRFVDDDQSDSDAVSDKLHIRYLYIYTESGLQYPCEQCHSPNKHYINPSLGSPSKFSAGNSVNQTINSTSTWCQQCHWDGADNYSEMIQEFTIDRSPTENVPPEITGNASYAPTGVQGFVNHSGYGMDDASCFTCHGYGAVESSTTTEFIHNVQKGQGGNRRCITCHNTSASNTNFKKVDVDALRNGMHANLKNSSANVSNTSGDPIELACWACHGDGLYNEEDTHHPEIKTCDKCHTNTTGGLDYSAPMVSEHIPPGSISPEADITTTFNAAGWICADCHNNSINTTALLNDNEINPINATTGHYGLNRTAGSLMYNYSMPPKGNTEDCTYCHKGSNSNMTKWGIDTSTTKNLSNKGSHSSYTTDQCGGCHGYTVNNSVTFHIEDLNAGAGSGPDCMSCHDTSVSGTEKGHIDFDVYNTSIHGSMSTNDSITDPNEACWACHGDGTSGGHNSSRYKNPYICQDCHVSGGIRYSWATSLSITPALTVGEHYTGGTDISASTNANTTYSCLACHEATGEMLLPNNDIDANLTIWSGGGDGYGSEIGNYTSPYHYGKNRSDLTPDTDSYCNYCHNNASATSIWAWEDSAHNTSIVEHTTNTSANITNTTTLNCNDCHGTGRIHNSTLIKPVQSAWTTGKNDYCSPCHTPGGNAAKKVYNQWHDPENSSDNITSCNYCHDSGSPGDIASSNALRVHSDNLTFPTGATSCVGCHNASSTYVKSRKILTHFPGASNDKANTSLSGRTCELCHGINGQSMHASGLVKKPDYGCDDCHVSTASGPYWANQTFNTYIDTTSHDNTSSPNVTDCNWCHNSSEAPEPFHFTQWANGSIENPGWGGWSAGMPVNCTDCHDSVNSGKTPFYGPAKTHPGTGNNTDECYGCHTSVNAYADEPLAVHSVVSAPGNANCTMCHDSGGAASKEVDVSAMNQSNSIHINLNSGATVTNATAPYATDTKRCWACHGDGTDKNEHDQARYKNPYQCEDCHTPSGSKSGTYPTFNVTEHTISGTDIKTPNAGLCTDCHNSSGMVRSNSDSEISSANASVGHYGKKRMLDGNDFPFADTIGYCNECHNNGSTVFPFIDNANKTIANHSLNYPSSNPSCLDSDCHSTGRIHNSSLKMPALALPNSTYCTESCHGAGGTASINNLERHNSSSPSSPDCSKCHLNSSKSIHPVRYLDKDGSTWDNTNSSAVNCTTCHQGTPPTGFETSPIIPSPLNHSTNNFSGGLWGSYWDNTSQQDSCRYCHGNISYHNSSGLGYVLSVKGTNTVRMGFSGTWCSNCHYSGAPEYSVSAFSPAPPEITTSASPNDPDVTWYNHSSDVSSDYTDAKCKECHNNNLDGGATSLNFTHNLGAGGAGPDCIACHDSGQGSARVDFTAINSSMHWNLQNTSASDTTSDPINRICWACHQSDGTQPTGHPDKKSSPYNCTDCHRNASRPSYVSGAIQVDNHFESGTNITALTGSGTDDASCIGCHIKPEMVVSYTEPDAVWSNNSLTSHYGKNRTDLRALSSDDYCNYCHSNVSSAYDYDDSHNREIIEHTVNNTADINNGTTLNCIDCHTTNNQAAWIHNSTLKIPAASAWTSGKQDYCASCHLDSDSGSMLNISNELHNTSGTISDCGYCHNSDAMKVGNAYLNIHSDNLTAGGNATYNNCYNCHQDGFASRVIIEHTNDTGANITNTSMTCDKTGCHANNQTHSSTLVKPVPSAWTAGGNDYCAPCHNSSDSQNNATKKIYNAGHNPAGSANDNVTSCGNCHNSTTPGAIPFSFRLHDVSMTKSPVEASASTCQGCHNGTTTYVGIGKQVLSHIPNSSQYRGNTTTSNYTCEYCHNMTGKPSMHSQGMTRSNGTCDSCHYNNTSPFKSLTKNITQLAGGMVNHTYDGRDVNTCNVTMCHNSSGRVKFHLSEYASGDIGDPQDSGGIKTFENRAESGDPNDRGVLVDCRDCHETYNDTEPFNAPHFEANNTGINNQEHVDKGYTLNNCFVCHTFNDDVNQPITMHNVSIEPLSGGPACQKCHDIGATDTGKAPDNMQVNFTAFSNYSVHKGLTNSTAWGGSPVFTLIDTACWVCHQSDGKQPERHPDKKDENYMAYECDECHAVGGNASTYQPSIYQNATKIYKHRPGAVFAANKVFSNNVRCSECHENSLVANLDISGYSANVYANDTNVSHYAVNRSFGEDNEFGIVTFALPNSTDDNGTGCTKCHKVGAGSSIYGPDYGNARNIPGNHNIMGSNPQPCERACHNSNSVAVNMHNNSMGIYVGSQTCYATGCHTPPPTGGGSGGRR